MQTKLTLRLDDELIGQAKSYAEAHGVSLSRLVAELFAQLSPPGRQSRDSAWIVRLRGVARPDGPAPDDQAVRQAYRDRLEEKHR